MMSQGNPADAVARGSSGLRVLPPSSTLTAPSRPVRPPSSEHYGGWGRHRARRRSSLGCAIRGDAKPLRCVLLCHRSLRRLFAYAPCHPSASSLPRVDPSGRHRCVRVVIRLPGTDLRFE